MNDSSSNILFNIVNQSHNHSVTIGRTILAERKRQKLSLDELARRSDVSKGMLSQIEQGKSNPTVVVLYRVAVGLQIDIAKLLPKAKNAPHVWRIIRSDDENYVFAKTKDCQLRTLSPLDLEKQIEFYEVTFAPHGKLISEPHFEGAEEILTVAKGHLKLKAGEKEADLHSRDSAYYAADVPHAIHNLGNTEAVAYMIVRWYRS